MPVRPAHRLTARNADRYALYTAAVQSPEADVAFFHQLYEKLNGRPPVHVREDFCGTAAISFQWIHAGPGHRAIAVDLDPEPLRWAREHYLPLFAPEARRRITLRKANVLNVRTPRMDVILALNFSYCVFKERKTLLRYLRNCRNALAPGGVMILDTYGGPDGRRAMETRTKLDGCTFVWEQASYNPITAEAVNHIHFLFPDGSRLRRAFSYDWRIWTPAELTDLLREAGYREARVYWEARNRRGERTGVYHHRTRAIEDENWVAYIVGWR